MKYEFECQYADKVTKIIMQKYPKINFLQVKTALRKKDVKINGKRINSDIGVCFGDKIELFLPNEKEIEIPVVYEDDNICICNKPCGIETTTADKSFDSKSLEELTHYSAVHRLDKNTEGLVILSKNQKANAELLRAFKNKEIEKSYKTLVFGKLSPKNTTLHAYIVKDSTNKQVSIYNHKTKDSSEIITQYEVLEEFENTSLLEVKIPTGKTHQIRAHLAHINHSIVGDDKYGNKKNNKKFHYNKQCLTAYKLKFNLPKTSFLSYLNNIKFQIEPTWSVPELNIDKK